MIDRLSKLLTVKSIVTILLTLGFIYLCIVGQDIPETLKTIYTMVVGFYFGTQKVNEV